MLLGHSVPDPGQRVVVFAVGWVRASIDAPARRTPKTEAANLTIKNTKRTGRGFSNPAHYRCRIMLTSAAKTTV